MANADPNAPHSFHRRLLLLTMGLAPQVVTETLYALTVVADPAYVPTEIHIVTTDEGANRAELTLLPPGQDNFGKLRREFGLPDSIQFGMETIHVLHNQEGMPLTDIRAPQDNQSAADQITELVRDMTSDPDSALHVSLAGGRKTLGFYLGYALSLFGRPQDRLSHVLVGEPFESHPQFYFPPRKPAVLISRDNKPISTRDANITLAEIPFVRLREGIPDNLLAGTTGYSTVVENLQLSVLAPELLLDPSRQIAVCNGVDIRLPPAQFAFYAWMARLRQKTPENSSVHWADIDPAGFLCEYRALVGELSDAYEKASISLANGFTKELFEERKSRINSIIRKVLGPASAPYQIQASGHRPRTQHGLTLPPRQIHFIESSI